MQPKNKLLWAIVQYLVRRPYAYGTVWQRGRQLVSLSRAAKVLKPPLSEFWRFPHLSIVPAADCLSSLNLPSISGMHNKLTSQAHNQSKWLETTNLWSKPKYSTNTNFYNFPSVSVQWFIRCLQAFDFIWKTTELFDSPMTARTLGFILVYYYYYFLLLLWSQKRDKCNPVYTIHARNFMTLQYVHRMSIIHGKHGIFPHYLQIFKCKNCEVARQRIRTVVEELHSGWGV